MQTILVMRAAGNYNYGKLAKGRNCLTCAVATIVSRNQRREMKCKLFLRYARSRGLSPACGSACPQLPDGCTTYDHGHFGSISSIKTQGDSTEETVFGCYCSYRKLDSTLVEMEVVKPVEDVARRTRGRVPETSLRDGYNTTGMSPLVCREVFILHGH